MASIEVVGPGVRDYEEGDWVIPLRDGLGTFTSLAIWDDKDFMKVPRRVEMAPNRPSFGSASLTRVEAAKRVRLVQF